MLEIKNKRKLQELVRSTMHLAGEVLIEPIDNFEKNARYELMNEINSVDNLDWIVRKLKTMKEMNNIKVI
jgi:hypothetical protein